MEFSPNVATLLGAAFLTGLSAGLFYAWQVSVIPGTRKLGDMVYLQTMQAINREILNPGFFLIFFGSLVLLAINSFQQYQSDLAFWLVLTACLAYLFGTLVVTSFGNVPLNNELEALELGGLSLDQLKRFRKHYEAKWNRLHLIRTFFAVLAFFSSLAALWVSSSPFVKVANP